MATLAVLRAQIDDDLANSAALTNAQIDAAIVAAIGKVETMPFWFNRTRSLTFSTVAGQSEYTSSAVANIGYMVSIDRLMLVESGPDTELDFVGPDEIDYLISQETGNNEPRCWSYDEDSIRLYPTPDAVYSVRMAGTRKFAALSANGDENAWTIQGRELIRCLAKVELVAHLIKDDAEASRMSAMAQDALGFLMEQNSRRTARGAFVPTQF